MKGFIFISLILSSTLSQAQLECDSVILETVTDIFNKTNKSIIHNCLHIQDMEKIVTVVERSEDSGALSLFVFAEKGIHQLSKPLSSIKAFAINGLKTVASNKEGVSIKNGVGYYYREAFKEGVIVLQYKNENDYYDVSLVRLTANGRLKNFNLHAIDSKSIEMLQAENMDLFVFKVSPGNTIDIFPGSNKVVIKDRFNAKFRQEIHLGGNRRPASQNVVGE